MSIVCVSGSFDDLRSPQVRFLEEAARLGPVHVALWSDAVIEQIVGKAPKFVEAERKYLLESIRYVDCVTLCGSPVDRDRLPLDLAGDGGRSCVNRSDGPRDVLQDRAPSPSNMPGTWLVGQSEASAAKEAYCRQRGLAYRVIGDEELRGFPEVRDTERAVPSRPVSAREAGRHAPAQEDRSISALSVAQRKKVIVTGCYDWFHSGHVRFFEEVSALGELYVCIGHDANIRFLKGEGHPLFPAEERRYMVQSIRFVHRALVSSGDGWLDAEPEIERLRPDIYAVNEDGDRPEKRAYCEAHGIQYRVLKRVPKEGLPRRQSTDLRGF